VSAKCGHAALLSQRSVSVLGPKAVSDERQVRDRYVSLGVTELRNADFPGH